jgi:hypothetical protein
LPILTIVYGHGTGSIAIVLVEEDTVVREAVPRRFSLALS